MISILNCWKQNHIHRRKVNQDNGTPVLYQGVHWNTQFYFYLTRTWQSLAWISEQKLALASKWNQRLMDNFSLQTPSQDLTLSWILLLDQGICSIQALQHFSKKKSQPPKLLGCWILDCLKSKPNMPIDSLTLCIAQQQFCFWWNQWQWGFATV